MEIWRAAVVLHLGNTVCLVIKTCTKDNIFALCQIDTQVSL